MAHGLPDYYRGVDIAYQALSEMIIRPKYGGAQRTEGSVVVTASSLNTLVSMSGKGMIYGGYARLVYTSSQKNSVVQLSIDGGVIVAENFNSMNTYQLVRPRTFPLVLNKYDDAAFRYSASIAYGLTFETSFTLEYDEKHGTTPEIVYKVVYALI